jgi:hypothetical protein
MVRAVKSESHKPETAAHEEAPVATEAVRKNTGGTTARRKDMKSAVIYVETMGLNSASDLFTIATTNLHIINLLL